MSNNDVDTVPTKCTPLEAYILYIAVKNHFTKPSYDIFKYKGKSRVTQASLDKRNDRYFFEKLSKKYNSNELRCIYVSNFIVNNSLWIGDIAKGDRSVTVYNQWKSRIMRLEYTYTEELKLIKNFMDEHGVKLSQLIVSKDPTKHPVLLQFLINDFISIETFCILESSLEFCKYFNRDLELDEVWRYKRKIVLKYSPFLAYDKEYYKQITLNIFRKK